jgi:hypothetical protein
MRPPHCAVMLATRFSLSSSSTGTRVGSRSQPQMSCTGQGGQCNGKVTRLAPPMTWCGLEVLSLMMHTR